MQKYVFQARPSPISTATAAGGASLQKTIKALIAATIGSLLCAQTATFGQDAYPTRPIKFIVPYSAGGPLDVLARSLGRVYQERYGQNLVIENRPGANTAIAASSCKNATPDGYTVCMLSAATISFNQYLYSKLTYDPHSDFEPISNLVFNRQVLVVHPSIPVKNLAELVAYSKSNPSKLNYASFGRGSDNNLTLEWIKSQTGAKFAHIPFGGAAPALLAFERGDVHLLMFTAAGVLLEKIRQGSARPILVSGDTRISTLPDVPTFAEAGLPNFRVRTWFGVFSPKGTPKTNNAILSRQLASIISDRSFQEQYLLLNGFEPAGSTPEQLAEHIAATQDDAQKLVALSGGRLD